ncbi:amidase [Pandoraea terrae]|uniref:Amidase n=1 Tax=Pandoraea terrae TaxID=1537710 RepID=A0A5E4WI68_9BURK|nr:amidase family protein [Pandoraea terrae]VVE24161.1 amidase [Pandoraea terrae]
MGRTYAGAGETISQDDYRNLDATGMAEAVRRGEVTPEALLAAAHSLSDAINPRINAVVMRHDERARDLVAARRLHGRDREGALAGVPTLIKDLNTYVAGTATTNGCRFLKEAEPATRSSTLVERYEAAGMVVFGKSSSPEFGLTATTESLLWGKTRNPWDLSRSAGGSSGGAAAAVAAGIVPIAHATDGGGSIRIPASYCGLFGLKPTRYRTPNGPDRFEGWFGASAAHVVSRSVRDSALALDVSHGREPGSAYWTRPVTRPFTEEAQRDPSALRIAVVTESLTGMSADPSIRAVLETTVGRLGDLGHAVEASRFPVDASVMFGAHGAVTGTALVKMVRDREAALGRSVTDDDLEPISHYILKNAMSLSAEKLYRARETFELVSRQMEAMFERYDIILSPVTATMPAELGRLGLDRPYDEFVGGMMGCSSFTAVANVGGQPSMSVPCGMSAEGLPIGMMFTAALGAEGVLFQLAGQWERAWPWAAHRPPLR